MPAKKEELQSPSFFFTFLTLAQRDIQDHHDKKTCQNAQRANMRMLSKMRFRTQFLYDNLDHRACRKGEQPGHNRGNCA